MQSSVGIIYRSLRKANYAERVAVDDHVYLAAVLEHLVAEVLEPAGSATRDNKKSRINLRHLQLVVRNNKKLNKIFHAIVAQNGVLPKLNAAFLREDF